MVQELHGAKNTPSSAEAYTFWVCSPKKKVICEVSSVNIFLLNDTQWINYGLKTHTPNHLTTLNCLHSVVCQRWQGRVLSLPHIWGMLCRHYLTKTRLFSTCHYVTEGKKTWHLRRLFVLNPGPSGSVSPDDRVPTWHCGWKSGSWPQQHAPPPPPYFPHLSCFPLRLLVKTELPWKS